MRVFVTGATGALGRHLVPALVAAGHEVTATMRTPGKAGWLREVGAEPGVVDGLDREAVIAAGQASRPGEDRRRSARVAAHPVGYARAGGDRACGEDGAGAGTGGARAALRRGLRARRRGLS